MSLPQNDPNASPPQQLRNSAALNGPGGGGLSFGALAAAQQPAGLGNLQNLQGLSGGGFSPALLSSLGGMSGSSGIDPNMAQALGGSLSGANPAGLAGLGPLASQQGNLGGTGSGNLQQDIATLASVQNQVNAAELRTLLQGGAGPSDLGTDA